MTEVTLKSQRLVMERRRENLRELFKGFLSNDSKIHKRARDKLSKWLWENPELGKVVKRSFSQTNFDDSSEFYHNSLQETFLKFDKIIAAFCRKNQITLDNLDKFDEQKFSIFLIRYFNQAHYNKACDLYQKWERKNIVNGQIIVSLDQPKIDADGQEYKTVGEEIPDHKNLNDLDNFNLGNFSSEAIDNLPIIGSSAKAIDRLRNCAKKLDCFEILIMKCQGYKDKQIGEKMGVNQSTVSRNWQHKCLKCINQIIAENNLE